MLSAALAGRQLGLALANAPRMDYSTTLPPKFPRQQPGIGTVHAAEGKNPAQYTISRQVRSPQ